MKVILVIFLLSASSVKLFAQTNNSPYSILGIGDIEDSYFNRTSGMANTGLAFRSNQYLILNNPASLSGLTNRLFNAEVGIRGTVMNYKGAGVDLNNNQSSDITFKKIIVGTKITKHWGSSGGLVPFSTQSYEFTSPDPTIGNDYFQGNGGLNKVYWANAYEFFNHLSIGLDAGYLFGSLQQKKTAHDANNTELYSQTNNINLTNGYLTYGLQYYGSITKKWDFVIGGTFSNQTNLLGRNTITLITPTDSVVPLYTNTLPQTYFTLPKSYGAGISITKNKKYTFLADYKYQAWSDLHYSGFNYALRNSSRFSLGFELSKKKNYYNTLVESRFLQAGFYYTNSYLDVYGQQLKDIGGTVGMGINSKRSLLSYTIAFQYGIRGVNNLQQIQQRYGSITFSISYRDVWSSTKVRFF
jgi:hypothetical protein